MSERVILLFGLPGSGKTSLSKDIHRVRSDITIYNADAVRKGVDDWDFSLAGRVRQAERMKALGQECSAPIALLDFVCPTPELRLIVNPSIMLWMNTIAESRYDDTNKMFVVPTPAERQRNGFVEIPQYISSDDVATFMTALIGPLPTRGT